MVNQGLVNQSQPVGWPMVEWFNGWSSWRIDYCRYLKWVDYINPYKPSRFIYMDRWLNSWCMIHGWFIWPLTRDDLYLADLSCSINLWWWMLNENDHGKALFSCYWCWIVTIASIAWLLYNGSWTAVYNHSWFTTFNHCSSTLQAIIFYWMVGDGKDWLLNRVVVKRVDNGCLWCI